MLGESNSTKRNRNHMKVFLETGHTQAQEEGLRNIDANQDQTKRSAAGHLSSNDLSFINARVDMFSNGD